MDTLSFDILFEITKYLSPLDLIVLKRINKRYNVLVNKDLWTYYLTWINLEEPGKYNEYAKDEKFWLIRGFPCVECWGTEFESRDKYCDRCLKKWYIIVHCNWHFTYEKSINQLYNRFFTNDRFVKKGANSFYCTEDICCNSGSNDCVSYKCKNCCRSKFCPLHSPCFR